MTHFAVVAPALPSHFRALQALGVELVSRGHRVIFVHVAAGPQLARPHAAPRAASNGWPNWSS